MDSLIVHYIAYMTNINLPFTTWKRLLSHGEQFRSRSAVTSKPTDQDLHCSLLRKKLPNESKNRAYPDHVYAHRSGSTLLNHAIWFVSNK